MKLTFLGTGTSCGVPTIGCKCHTCSSPDPHDKRLRCSALVETPQTRLLIDCGPDFREQIMPHPFRRIDGILITHAHYDHMGGMDDIRPYCQFGEINVYADPIARKVMHHDLPILGYRIEEMISENGKTVKGKSLVYITDMKTIDAEEIPFAEHCDVLVVNALRLLPHHSHQTLDEAVDFARHIAAPHTWLIHSSHDMPRHADVNALLPSNIQMAFDGQVIEI